MIPDQVFNSPLHFRKNAQDRLGRELSSLSGKTFNHPPPSGSTANILVALLPLSFMLAATPETRPPPPQHTITTSGFGISSNISTPALAIE